MVVYQTCLHMASSAKTECANHVLFVQLQVKALEPEVQALAPYKSKLAAAEQLLAMLAGSKQINPRNGQAFPSINGAPQVWLTPSFDPAGACHMQMFVQIMLIL
jgi:hypothetical protein